MVIADWMLDQGYYWSKIIHCGMIRATIFWMTNSDDILKLFLLAYKVKAGVPVNFIYYMRFSVISHIISKSIYTKHKQTLEKCCRYYQTLFKTTFLQFFAPLTNITEVCPFRYGVCHLIAPSFIWCMNDWWPIST